MIVKCFHLTHFVTFPFSGLWVISQISRIKSLAMILILAELCKTREICKIYFFCLLHFLQEPQVSAIDRFDCINYRSNLKVTYQEVYCKFSCKEESWIDFFVISDLYTAWKVSVFGVFLVRIFPHSDWIRRDTANAAKSVQIRENTDQKNSEYGYFSHIVKHLVSLISR